MGEALIPPKGGVGSSSGGSSGDLSPITVTPTGTEFTVEGSFSAVTVEGDANLKPENIAVGVTIYGVTGSTEIAANTEKFPEEYRPYVEEAKTYYTGTYEDIFVSEDNDWITVGFMLSNFEVRAYDSESTEFFAIGWICVAYEKATDTWKTDDWSSDVSRGWNYINNMRYCTNIIYYSGVQIFPMKGQGETISFAKTVGTFTSGVYTAIYENPTIIKGSDI